MSVERKPLTDEKKEIKRQLNEYCEKVGDELGSYVPLTLDHLFDFILADRQRILCEIEKPLKEVKRKLPMGYYDVLAVGKEITFLNAIDETLSKIQEHMPKGE